MPSPTTPADLLEMVRHSGLIPADRLTTYLQSKHGQLPAEPARIAAALVNDGLLTKFQAAQILKGRYKNFMIGRYRVLEPLGAGGMSRVYLCEHATMGHRVAMKLLPVQQGADPSMVERFFREARAVAALNHPNIVRAHDVAEEPGKFHYLVMDFVDGVNLHDLVQRHGPLSPERAAHYISQAAEGLQHIHESGLVHRDLKPGNLLLDRSGMIKILDLGLARFNESESGPSITKKYDDKAILGTADFLSPEQAIQSSTVDIRADIYSLGATMYFLLAGRPPFPGDNVTQKLLAHQIKAPEPLGKLRPDLPPELIAVVDKMMAKKPEERYQQPIELVSALAAWTAEPIDPPTDEELPSRGPAASGASSQIQSRVMNRSVASTRRAAQGSSISNAPVSSGSSLSQTPAPRKNLTLPATGLDPKKKKLAMAGGAAGLLALLGITAWAFWPVGGSPAPVASGDQPKGGSPVAKTPAGPTVVNLAGIPDGALVVAAQGGQYPTVAAALAAAKPGDRILVANKTHEEALSISEPPVGVSIESWPTREQVVWRLPANQPVDRPMIDLAQCKNLKISGFAFEGLDQAEDIVRVRTLNPGTTIENCTFRGFTKSGVRFVGGGGGPGSPVRVGKVRFVTARADVPAAVSLDRGAGGATCKYLNVVNCRIEGPFVAGVLCFGPASDVEIVGNRFHKAASAVRYPRNDPPPPLQLTFAANTVADARIGLHFETLPPADTSRITVQNNLFIRTAKLALLDGVTPEPGELPAFVWYDDKLPKDKATNVPAGKRFFRKTFTLDKAPEKDATLDIGCVNSFRVWVNGAPVGQSAGKYFNKRVYAFDVKNLLRPGKNVIAVEGENQTDPFNAFLLVAAGLGARLTVDDRLVTATDESWKASREAPDGWLAPEYPDAAWAGVKVWPAVGANYLWNGAVWDSEVARQLGAKRLPIVARGNVRDYFSGESYPLLESLRAFVKEMPTDPKIDATFLRYDRTSPLNTAGADKDPVGCPPND